MSCSSFQMDIEESITKKSLVNMSVQEQEDEPIVNSHIKPRNKVGGHTSYVSPDETITKKFMEELLSMNLNVSNQVLEEMLVKLRYKYRIHPSKPEMRMIYETYFKHIEIPKSFKRWMIKRSTRSLSGVLVVTVTLSPHNFSCKYDCFYCPQETDRNGKPTQPRSYLSNEPAMMRALQFDFDIRKQFWDRIKSYLYTGNIDSDMDSQYKMEVILSGGTWESYPKEYRERVMNELYWAANTYGGEIDRDILSLEDEVKTNETAKFRIIGLTIETRPDNITKEAIQDYRRWGVTRVQIGVQHYDDAILRKLNRKCYTKDTINAIRLLKQVGLKVVVHLMPDLPGSNPELDKWMFDQAVSRPELQFDDVKIYPTAVCKSSDENLIVKSKIADWYSEGTFTPYAEKNIDDLYDVLMHYKKQISPWVRIQRLVRDIPSKGIEAGYHKMTNLRQVLQDKMKKNGDRCLCIRCMEIRDTEVENLETKLVVRPYYASEGMEYHLSMEAVDFTFYEKLQYWLFMMYSTIYWFFTGKTIYWSGNLNSYRALYGFLRLRIDPNPGGDFIPELKNCALIREVHVYGQALGVGSNTQDGGQHIGIGRTLMNVAETIAQQNGYNKTAVIAGVGTREYYMKKCGYHLEGTYMIKSLLDYNYKCNQRILISLLISFSLILSFVVINYFI